MKIIPLSEGVFTIDKTKVFVPFDLDTDDLQKRSTGSLLVEVQPFVVVTSRDILLLDTGLGFSKNGELQLISNLNAAGINASDVTKVLMSHLHKDHAGGISKRDRLGNYSLSFPNATYYVQEEELAFALDTGFPSFMAEEISILSDNPQVRYVGDEGTIDGYIRHWKTGGHSPHHQVFWIEDGNEILFFGADDAPQLQQMKSKFVAKYDFDGKKCMQLRQQWWKEGNEKGWTFLFYHDVKTPTFKSSEV
jgi:glyoxylase-like metal-dependent hydrolase (beta-lactamase superfamily II)